VDEQLMTLVTEECGLVLEAPWTSGKQRQTLCATAVPGTAEKSLGDEVVFGRMGTTGRSVRSVIFPAMEDATAQAASLNE
jgi:hypothetical protein